MLIGFDYDGTPRLYQTDPSGTYHEWKANAIGRNAKTVREFLEKNYAADKVVSENDTVKLAIKVLNCQAKVKSSQEKVKRKKDLTLLTLISSLHHPPPTLNF